MWADATEADFASTSSNQFLVRASGGVGLGTNNPQAALHVAGTVRANSFQGDGSGLSGLSVANLGGGTISGTINFNPAGGPPFTVGNQTLVGGLNADFLDGWHGSHYWQLGGNSGAGPYDFLGTTDNQALELRVNGQRALRLEPNDSGAPNVVGGSLHNYVKNNVVGATIGGGGAISYKGLACSNSVTGDFGTIGGGAGNLATWNYKTQDASIRHIGPMAQDFHAAFGVGDSDKTITTVDADGVALAAIQGLNQKLEEKNAALEQQVAELAALVRTLSEKVNGGGQ